MSYEIDSKAIAVYDDNVLVGGSGGAAWNLVDPVSNPTAPATEAMVALFGGPSWAVEREVVAYAGPGTVLELGAWGETEAVNIQCVIGWDDLLRPFVGWEVGDGQDYRVRADTSLPAGALVRLAVTRDSGTICMYANGSLLVRADGMPLPTGGTYPGGVTPGMTLAIGRRVSSVDPDVYDGGGWLRISESRTAAEIRADWRRSLSPPAPSGLTWADLAAQDHADIYFAFRGQYRAFDKTPGETVDWATRYVAADEVLTEGRLMQAPGPIVRGIPETLGAPPERVSTSITVDNTDGALVTPFRGGENPVTAYRGDSVLSLSGRLYVGIVGPDGVAVEQPVTPTMAVQGEPQRDDRGQVVLPLASADRRVLGPAKALVTVGQIREADFEADGLVYIGDGSIESVAFNASRFDLLKSALRENLDTVVPWAYGRCAIKTIPTGESVAGHYRLAYLSMHEPRLDDMAEWEFLATWSRGPHLRRESWRVFSVQIRVALDDGTEITPWLVGTIMPRVGDDESSRDRYLVPSVRAYVGMPNGRRTTPAAMIRQIVTDLSERGAAAIDAESFERVDRQLPAAGRFGGVIGSNAPLSEVLTHIAGPVGAALWMGTDDRLHIMLPLGWDAEDEAIATGPLPHIDLTATADGTFADRIPTGSVAGAPASRVTIDWSSEQRDFFQASELPAAAPGMTRLALAEEAEARVSGAWLWPIDAIDTMQAIASRRSFAHRRISVVAPLWMAAYELGQLVRVTHPMGSYDRALARLVRSEIIPGEAAVRCELVELEALEQLRVGKLDTIDNWIAYRPNGSGATATLKAGSAVVKISGVAVDEKTWLGCTFGAWTTSANRSAKKIIAADAGDGTITVSSPYAEDEVLPGAPVASAIDEWWIVLHNRATKGWDYRPDYITLADDTTGEHSDGKPGFVMMGG